MHALIDICKDRLSDNKVGSITVTYIEYPPAVNGILDVPFFLEISSAKIVFAHYFVIYFYL